MEGVKILVNKMLRFRGMEKEKMILLLNTLSNAHHLILDLTNFYSFPEDVWTDVIFPNFPHHIAFLALSFDPYGQAEQVLLLEDSGSAPYAEKSSLFKLYVKISSLFRVFLEKLRDSDCKEVVLDGAIPYNFLFRLNACKGTIEKLTISNNFSDERRYSLNLSQLPSSLKKLTLRNVKRGNLEMRGSHDEFFFDPALEELVIEHVSWINDRSILRWLRERNHREVKIENWRRIQSKIDFFLSEMRALRRRMIIDSKQLRNGYQRSLGCGDWEWEIARLDDLINSYQEITAGSQFQGNSEQDRSISNRGHHSVIRQRLQWE